MSRLTGPVQTSSGNDNDLTAITPPFSGPPSHSTDSDRRKVWLSPAIYASDIRSSLLGFSVPEIAHLRAQPTFGCIGVLGGDRPCDAADAALLGAQSSFSGRGDGLGAVPYSSAGAVAPPATGADDGLASTATSSPASPSQAPSAMQPRLPTGHPTWISADADAQCALAPRVGISREVREATISLSDLLRGPLRRVSAMSEGNCPPCEPPAAPGALAPQCPSGSPPKDFLSATISGPDAGVRSDVLLSGAAAVGPPTLVDCDGTDAAAPRPGNRGWRGRCRNSADAPLSPEADLPPLELPASLHDAIDSCDAEFVGSAGLILPVDLGAPRDQQRPSSPSSSSSGTEHCHRKNRKVIVLSDKVLASRERQIHLGTTTIGFENLQRCAPYVADAARWQIPHTPNAADLISKRHFDARLRAWRTYLHLFDSIDVEAVVKRGDAGEQFALLSMAEVELYRADRVAQRSFSSAVRNQRFRALHAASSQQTPKEAAKHLAETSEASSSLPECAQRLLNTRTRLLAVTHHGCVPPADSTVGIPQGAARAAAWEFTSSTNE